jgi:hypothetical protein
MSIHGRACKLRCADIFELSVFYVDCAARQQVLSSARRLSRGRGHVVGQRDQQPVHQLLLETGLLADGRRDAGPPLPGSPRRLHALDGLPPLPGLRPAERTRRATAPGPPRSARSPSSTRRPGDGARTLLRPATCPCRGVPSPRIPGESPHPAPDTSVSEEFPDAPGMRRIAVVFPRSRRSDGTCLPVFCARARHAPTIL